MAVIISGAAIGGQSVTGATSDSANWANLGNQHNNQHYSELDQTNDDNANDPRPVWSFSTSVVRGHEGGPIVVGDMLYVLSASPPKVAAINLKDRVTKWVYEPIQHPDVVPGICCDTANPGLAYAPGTKPIIILQQADTKLVALDAESGKQVWSTVAGDPGKGQTNVNAPLVVKDKVITSISGNEFGARGFVAAYNLKDGKLAWKAYRSDPTTSSFLILPGPSMQPRASPSARTPALRLGEATSGRSATAPPGAAGIVTTRSLI